jgi:uncharacterized protein (DUF2164 family)
MPIEITAQESAEVAHSLKKYFREEFDQELSDLKAKLLINYLLQEIGPFAYNRGVADAERFLRARLEDLSATCFEAPLTYWKKKTR